MAVPMNSYHLNIFKQISADITYFINDFLKRLDVKRGDRPARVGTRALHLGPSGAPRYGVSKSWIADWLPGKPPSGRTSARQVPCRWTFRSACRRMHEGGWWLPRGSAAFPSVVVKGG